MKREREIAWLAKVDSRKLSFVDSDGFVQYLDSLNGKPVEVIVRKLKKRRTSDQNEYYWAVIIKSLSDYFGYEKTETHDALLMEYARQQFGERRRGDKPPRIKRSSEMTTAEFLDYTGWARRFGAVEFGLNIPEPNEYS